MHIDTPEQIMQFLDVMQFHRRSSRIGQRECPEENSTGLIQKQLTIVEMTITTTTTTIHIQNQQQHKQQKEKTTIGDTLKRTTIAIRLNYY